ncbi:MAG: DUF502 domain-containing protein [Lentisphaerota bacterium]
MKKTEDRTVSSLVGKHIRSRLVSGLLVLVPLGITIFVLNILFASLNAFLLPALRPFMKGAPPYLLSAIAILAFAILVYLIGLITTHVIGRRLLNLAERVILKLPLIKTVYAASKQVVDTFSVSNRNTFKAVVTVKFPHEGSLALGFITGSILDPGGRELYRVFVPTTPNPTSGFLILLPKEEVFITDISVETGIKMIVSGGVLAPEQYLGASMPDNGFHPLGNL